MSIKIEVDGYDADTALDRAMERAAQQAAAAKAEELGEEAAAQIKAAVDAQVRTVTEEAVRAEVAAVLASGWTKTNHYGEPTGRTLTLKGLVLELLMKPDSYDRASLVEKIAREELHKALQKDFAKELEEARAKLRALIDGRITEQMREMLKGLFR